MTKITTEKINHRLSNIDILLSSMSPLYRKQFPVRLANRNNYVYGHVASSTYVSTSSLRRLYAVSSSHLRDIYVVEFRAQGRDILDMI